jgi:hypothetical protein
MNRNKAIESTIMLALTFSPAVWNSENDIEVSLQQIAEDMEEEGPSDQEILQSLCMLEDQGAITKQDGMYRITLAGFGLYPEETGGEC